MGEDQYAQHPLALYVVLRKPVFLPSLFLWMMGYSAKEMAMLLGKRVETIHYRIKSIHYLIEKYIRDGGDPESLQNFADRLPKGMLERLATEGPTKTNFRITITDSAAPALLRKTTRHGEPTLEKRLTKN